MCESLPRGFLSPRDGSSVGYKGSSLKREPSFPKKIKSFLRKNGLIDRDEKYLGKINSFESDSNKYNLNLKE